MQVYELYKKIRELNEAFESFKLDGLNVNVKAKDVFFNNKYNEGNVLFNKENVQIAIEALADVVDTLSNEGNQGVIPWINVTGKPFDSLGNEFDVRENILKIRDNTYSPYNHTHNYAPISHSNNTEIHVTDIDKANLNKIPALEISNNKKIDNVDIDGNKLIFQAGNEVTKEILLPSTSSSGDYAPIAHSHETDDITYQNPLYPNITNLKQALDVLLYIPINISLSSNVNSMQEKGVVVNSIRLNWTYNKEVQEQSINGTYLDKNDRTYLEIKSFSSDKKFTLSASDDINTVTKDIWIKFYDGLYYGVSSSNEYNNELVLSLNKELSSSRNKTFTTNCKDQEYIYYCIPTYFGTPEFSVGGFSGGFKLVNTIQFTNYIGYVETYNIYRSNNNNLGTTTVVVK